MVKVLITGDKGFIGSNLRRHLEEHGGYAVFGHDWKDQNHNKVADLREQGVFRRTFFRIMPDVVVHLAAQVGREFGEKSLEHTISSNAVMTTIIGHVTAVEDVKLLYASTSEVYGDQGRTDCREDSPLVLPHNLYGLSKRWGEEAIELYARHFQTVPQPIHMRFSMPYGPGVVPGRGRAALPNILWQAHNRMEIPIHYNSERSWCWIGDNVEAVRLLIDADVSGPFNVGRDDNSLSMEEAARIACRLTRAPVSLIKLIDPPAAQTLVKRLNTDKIRKLGWDPQVSLVEGMTQTLEWVKQFDASGTKVS